MKRGYNFVFPLFFLFLVSQIEKRIQIFINVSSLLKATRDLCFVRFLIFRDESLFRENRRIADCFVKLEEENRVNCIVQPDFLANADRH